MGFYVFPIQPGSKYPYAGFAWRKKSTNDPKLVESAGKTARYTDSNWALDVGKSGLFIVDIDKKPEDGIDGFISAKEKGFVFDSAFQVETPSGGRHYYYKGTGKNSASKLAPGVDTRGVGGYVLIPGSINSAGRAYAFKNQGAIPDAPKWIAEILGAPSERKPDYEIPLIDLDQEHNIQRAVDYLQNEAPEAFEGHGGNTTTYQTICYIRDMGISEDTCLSLATQYYNEKCIPPWPSDQLEKLVRNVYKYAKDRPGNATPDVLFSGHAISDDLMTWCDSIDASELKPREWILGYRYLPGYATITVAPGGTGKSTFILLEALSIAAGKKLTHDDVHMPGAVWLYNTEDPLDELKNRVCAAARHHNLSRAQMAKLAITSGYEHPVKLAALDDRGRPVANTGKIDQIIKRLVKYEIKLFVIDPLIRCHALNESNNDHMDFLMQIFARIAKESGSAISLVHHTPKGNQTRGDMNAARGAGALTTGARIAHTIFNMTPKEAADYGVPISRARWYMRIDNAKENLSPPGLGAMWYEKKSVQIFFGNDQTVGTVEPAEMDPIIEKEEGDALLIEKVADAMAPGLRKSVYALAAELNKKGDFNHSIDTLRRKILTVFSEPVAHLNMVLTLEANENKSRSYLICKDAENA